MSGENEDQVRADGPDGEQPQAEVHEWSAFYDADGSLYYYNATSGESSWEAPEIFNPPPPREGEEQQAEGDSDLQQQQELPDAQEQPSAEVEDPPDDGGLASPKHGLTDSTQPEVQGGGGGGGADGSDAAWVAYKDDEGREYFFNTVTNETTWEQPETFVRGPGEVEEEEDEFVGGRTPPGEEDDDGSTREESLSPDRPSSPIPMDEYIPTDEEEGYDDAVAIPDDEGEDEPVAEPEPKIETIDPAVKRLQDAEAALNTPDAIMEPGMWIL
jgi:WW domain